MITRKINIGQWAYNLDSPITFFKNVFIDDVQNEPIVCAYDKNSPCSPECAACIFLECINYAEKIESKKAICQRDNLNIGGVYPKDET